MSSHVSFATRNVIVFNSDLVADANSALVARQEKMRSACGAVPFLFDETSHHVTYAILGSPGTGEGHCDKKRAKPVRVRRLPDFV